MIFNLSHYDLDGVGCNIVLHNFFKESKTNIIRENCSYDKLTEKLFEMEDYIKRIYGVKYVFITDLSFEENQFKILKEIAKRNKNIKFYLIDHHPPKIDFKVFNTENLKIIISNKASATKLVYLFMKKNFKNFGIPNEPKNDFLEKFVEYVNAYDIWLKDTEEFQVGFAYNELFWYYKLDSFYNKFKDDQRMNAQDIKIVKQIQNDIKEHFEKIENNKLIFKDNKVLLIFTDKFHNYVTLKYKSKIYFIADMSQLGKFSVRLSCDIPNPEEIQKKIIQTIKSFGGVTNIGGHHCAFGFNIEDNTIQGVLKFSEKIANTFIKGK